MKIVGRVLQAGPIEKPTEKDLQKGLRYFAVLREEVSKKMNGKTYGEFLLYAVKMTDDQELIVDDVYLVDGKIWEMKDSDQVSIRGFSNPTFHRMSQDKE